MMIELKKQSNLCNWWWFSYEPLSLSHSLTLSDWLDVLVWLYIFVQHIQIECARNRFALLPRGWLGVYKEVSKREKEQKSDDIYRYIAWVCTQYIHIITRVYRYESSMRVGPKRWEMKNEHVLSLNPRAS